MQMNSKTHLIDYFPDYVDKNSLFQKMVDQGAPWDSGTGEAMDRAYFTMYSGVKNPSQFVVLNTAGEFANSITIAAILYSMYGEAWTRLWNAYKVQYDPIENYNLKENVETVSSDERITNRTNNLDSTVDGTEEQTSDRHGTGTTNGTTSSTTTATNDSTVTLEHGEQITRSGTADSYTFGFNSSEKAPTGSQVESVTDSHSGTDTTTTSESSSSDTNGTTKSDTDTTETLTTNIITKDTRADKTVEDTTDTGTGNETITRSRTGNIGVTTTQQMITQEIELWKWNFFFRVFEDVDRFLVLSVYSDCP